MNMVLEISKHCKYEVILEISRHSEYEYILEISKFVNTMIFWKLPNITSADTVCDFFNIARKKDVSFKFLSISNSELS